MKRYLLVLLAVLLTAAAAQAATPSLEQTIAHLERLREIGRVKATISNMRNLATAIEMFMTDHGDKLPKALQELTPEYLRTQPVDLVNRKPYVYQPKANGRFFLSVSGQPYASLGLPAGYPRLEARQLTKAELDAVMQTQKYPETTTVLLKPGQRFPRSSENRRGWELQLQGMQALSTANPERGLQLYQQALAAGGLDPLTEQELRSFLKACGK